MDFYHGVSTRQVDTSVSTPVTAGSGIVFAVGTAPVHTVGGKVNEPVMCTTYEEAVSAFGYSDDWGKYSLCEVIYSQFKLYGVSPVVLVNVLDPAAHKESIAAKAFNIADNQVMLPLEALKDTVVITGYTKGTDYDLFYSGENLILEVLEGGSIPADTTTLTVAFDAVKPGAVTKVDIIGGFDTTTKKTTGFELIDSVFPKYRIITDLLLAPGWSHDPEVAAIMNAKAAKINGIFEGKAFIDVDVAQVKHYADAPAWKKSKNINAKTQVLCYPMVKLGGRIFHLSVHAAGRTGLTDTQNGCPAEPPSNKLLQIDSVVLADGSEILLDVQQANYLNSNGIVTAINFIGGFVLWGNQTACFPADTDVKDYFISVSRMFAWVSNTIILTCWSKLDKKLVRRLIDNIMDTVNIWLNGLVSEEQLLGGRVEFRADENSTIALMAGKAVFHLYLTTPSPGQEYEFVLEYDVSYIESALTV